MSQVQECVRAGFPLLTLGAARSDLTSPALGALTLGSSLSLHGASQAPQSSVGLSDILWMEEIHQLTGRCSRNIYAKVVQDFFHSMIDL